MAVYLPLLLITAGVGGGLRVAAYVILCLGVELIVRSF